MWNNSGNWNFWPMQQSAYSNIPSEQVDWASLAKQWIANREIMGIGPDYPQPGMSLPPPLPPIKPSPPAGPLGEMSSVVGGNMIGQTQPQSIVCDMENSNSQDSNFYQSSEPELVSSEGWNSWNQSMPSWAVPPPPPPMEEVQASAMSEMPYGADGGQYVASSFGFNQPTEEMYLGPYEHSGYPQFWGQGPHATQQMIAQKAFGPVPENVEYRAPPKRGNRNWLPMGDIPPLMDDSGIDAAKRRNLPLWIREGLEKMEREKQRLMEKERQEQALLNAKKAKEEAEKENPEINLGQKGPAAIVKSIFDSDDEDTAAVEPKVIGQSLISAEPEKIISPVERKKSPSPDVEEEEEEPFLSEEEKQARMMLKVRQMLTEVLLDVTNDLVDDVAHSVYTSAKLKQAKAPARQLAKSSALASITSLGLGYGSESSDEDDDRRTSPNSESDESDDEAILHERIRKKKADFERKMREMEEKEREIDIEKKRQTEEQLKPPKDNRDAGLPNEASNIVEEVSVEREGQIKETVGGKRVRLDSDKKIKHQEKKAEKRTEEGDRERGKDKKKKANKKGRSVREEAEEEEEEESSESGSESDSESSSGSGTSNESSSETSESRKSSQTDSKERSRRQVKSQVSDGGKGSKKEMEVPRKRTNEDNLSSERRRDSGASRKEWERERQKNGEEKQRKKKRSRQHSEEEEEQNQKRRHFSRDDEKQSRHRVDEARPRRGQSDADDNQRKISSGSRRKRSRSRENQTRPDTDYYDERHDCSHDYSTRTYDYDEDQRSSKSRNKKTRRSRSSSLSSDRRTSRQSREKSPDHRRSTTDRRYSTGQDRERRKDAKDRSGKKERAKRRSRSRSRSDDY